jgi:cell division protein ZapA
VNHLGYIEVSIFGKAYKLKASPENEPYLKRIAKFVDERMSSAHKDNHTFSPTKIAVLTALNLADELFKFKSTPKEALGNLSDASPLVSEDFSAFQDKLASIINKLDKIEA